MTDKLTAASGALAGLIPFLLVAILAAPLPAGWEPTPAAAWPPPQWSHFTIAGWRLYGLSELQTFELNGGWRQGSGMASAALRHFGWPAYRELTGALGWARCGERLTAGLTLQLHRLQVRGYPPRQGINSGCHLVWRADSSWAAGARLDNWLPARCGERAATRFDLAWAALDRVRLHLSWLEQPPAPPGAYLALQWLLPRSRLNRIGLSYDNRSGQTGLMLQLAKGRMRWRLDLLLHPQLGWSQCMQSGWYF